MRRGGTGNARDWEMNDLSCNKPPLNPCQDAPPWTKPPSAPESCRPRAA